MMETKDSSMQQNSLLSYRTQLMGIGAIGVLAVHSKGIVSWDNIFGKVAGHGGIGVYLFVFLSAIGLYYSRMNVRGGYWSFEKRRFIRVGIPYLIISFIWYGIRYLLIERDVVSFFLDLSTISFWTAHRGAWYVAMLIPLYLVYPFYHKWITKGNSTIKSACVILALCIFGFSFSALSPERYSDYSQVICSYVIFALAISLADLIILGRFQNGILVIVWLLYHIVKVIIPWQLPDFVDSLDYALQGVAFMALSGMILKFIHCKPVNGLLGWIGGMSLELYICNIYLIQAYKYFDFNDRSILPGWAGYFILIALGFFISFLVHETLHILISRHISRNGLKKQV